MNTTLGIDPGVRGGLAVLAATGYPLHVEAFRPSWTHAELVKCVQTAVRVLLENGGWRCWVEKVGYMPGDGDRKSVV